MRAVAKVFEWIFKKLHRKKPIELHIQSANSITIINIHKD